MADSLGEAILDLRADDSSLNRGFLRADKGVSTLGGLFSGIAAQALKVTAIIGGVGLAAKGISSAFGIAKQGAIGMNAQLESSTLQFQTLLGNAGKAQKHVEGLFRFAAQTPFETGPIIAASKALLTFGGQALATQGNLRLVGDAAAAAGVPINEVGTWFGRAVSAIQSGRPFGEAAQRLQEMGILSSEARNRIEGLQKSGASAATVQAALTAEFERFNGAMKLQAGTWEGLTSTISDNVSLLSARAFRPFFDLLKSGAASFAEWLQTDRVAAWADSFASGLGRVIARGREFLGSVFSWGSALVSNAPVWTWAERAGAAFWQLVAIAQGVGSSIMASFQTLSATVGPSLSALFSALGPSIAGLFGPSIVEGITSFIGHATTLASTVLPPIIEGITSLLTYLQSSPEILATASSAVGGFVEGWLVWKGLNLAASFLALVAPILGVVAPIAAVAAALAAGALAGQFLVDNWSKFFAQGQQLAISFAGGVVGIISSMLRALGDAMGKIPGIGGALKAGLDAAADLADKGVAALGSKFAALEPAANAPIKSLSETVGNLASGITGAIAEVAPTISSTLGGAFTTATDAAKAGIASLGGFGPAASKAGGEAAAGIKPAGEAASTSRAEFDKMVELFNHKNPKITIDADDAYGRVERVSDDYLELVRGMDTNPALVNLDAENAQSALAALGADLDKLDNKNLAIDADTRAALSTLAGLPEPIAVRTLLVKTEVQGSPRMGFSAYFGSGGYAESTISGFLGRVSGQTLTLYSELAGAVEDAANLSASKASQILAAIAQERARLNALKDFGVRRNLDTGTGQKTELSSYFEALRSLEKTLDANLTRRTQVDRQDALAADTRADSRHRASVSIMQRVSEGIDKLGNETRGVRGETRKLNEGLASGRYGAMIAGATAAQIDASRGSRGYR